MIHYLTMVDGSPVVSVNGKNVSVKVKPANSSSLRSYKVYGVEVYSDFSLYAYNAPFTQIVLAVEIAREVMRIENA